MMRAIGGSRNCYSINCLRARFIAPFHWRDIEASFRAMRSIDPGIHNPHL